MAQQYPSVIWSDSEYVYYSVQAKITGHTARETMAWSYLIPPPGGGILGGPPGDYSASSLFFYDNWIADIPGLIAPYGTPYIGGSEGIDNSLPSSAGTTFEWLAWFRAEVGLNVRYVYGPPSRFGGPVGTFIRRDFYLGAPGAPINNTVLVGSDTNFHEPNPNYPAPPGSSANQYVPAAVNWPVLNITVTLRVKHIHTLFGPGNGPSDVASLAPGFDLYSFNPPANKPVGWNPQRIWETYVGSADQAKIDCNGLSSGWFAVSGTINQQAYDKSGNFVGMTPTIGLKVARNSLITVNPASCVPILNSTPQVITNLSPGTPEDWEIYWPQIASQVETITQTEDGAVASDVTAPPDQTLGYDNGVIGKWMVELGPFSGAGAPQPDGTLQYGVLGNSFEIAKLKASNAPFTPGALSLSLPGVSAGASVPGTWVQQKQNTRQWAGYRYLDAQLTLTNPNKTPARLFLGFSPDGVEQLVSDLANLEAAATLSTGNPFGAGNLRSYPKLNGIWYEISYDPTITGPQPIEIDLANPLPCLPLSGSSALIWMDAFGTGLPYMIAASPNLFAQMANGMIALYCDASAAAATLNAFALVDKLGARVRLYLGDISAVLSEQWQPDAVVKQPCEFGYNVNYQGGSATSESGLIIAAFRDNKPIASVQQDTVGDNVTVAQVLATLNSIGNGLAWEVDSDYFNTANERISALIGPDENYPGLRSWGDYEAVGNASAQIPLSFPQTLSIDAIPWWPKVVKQYKITERAHAIGLVFDDATGKPYSGPLTIVDGTQAAAGSPRPVTLAKTALKVQGTVASDGSFDLPLVGFTGNVAALQVKLSDLEGGKGIASADVATAFLPRAPLPQRGYCAVRFVERLLGDTRYSLARSALWTVHTTRGGWLEAVLLEAYDGRFNVQSRRRLPVKGYGPALVLSHEDGRAYLFYQRADGAAVSNSSADQFATLDGEKIVFAQSGGETAFCRDESTGQMVYIMCLPQSAIDQQNGVDPGTDPNGNQIVVAIRRKDGAGNSLTFQPQPNCYLSTIYENLLFTGSNDFGRPCIQATPPHRLMLSYGDNYWYSDDDGSTWFTSAGVLASTLTRLTSGLYSGGNP